MKIAVLVAFDEEIQPIVKAFHLKGPTPYEYTKQWRGDSFSLFETGIGKVNASAVTQLVILKEKPDLILNAGFCGGFKEKVSVGDAVIVSDVVQYDVDLTVFGLKIGALPGLEKPLLTLTVPNTHGHKYKIGTCVTGDRVLVDKKYGKWLYKQFKPSVIEMELGSIAQICKLNYIKLVSLKVPTDIVENEDVSSWKYNLDRCSKSMCDTFKKIIDVLIQ